MRAIGLPGETVSMQRGVVSIDGKPLTEPWPIGSRGYDVGPGLTRPFGPVRVPAGSLFVLGDCRDAANDSRYWGMLPRGRVTGKVLYIYAARDSARMGRRP